MNTPPPEIIQHLKQSELFADMADEVLARLTPPPEWIEVSGGEAILTQGGVGEYFYLLVHGRLGVFIGSDSAHAEQVATVEAGEGVGEMSLLTDRPITATVKTLRDSNLIRFSKASFDSLIKDHPQAALSITRRIIERLEKTLRGEKAPADLSTIMICSNSTHTQARPFADRLHQALTKLGSVAMITADTVPTEDFSQHLHSLEDNYDHVLMVCEANDNQWRAVCKRQSDKTLLLAPADQPAEDVSALSLDPVRTDLVLVHAENYIEDCSVVTWRDALTFDQLHHLRANQTKDYERLARILTGNANNLILSGGAAHSFAQIGVIRALEEAGIPIDRVCGTSMGSLIAAQYSLGMSFDDMLIENRKIWAEGKPLSDLTLPTTALVRGKRLQTMIRNALGDRDIEALPLQFSCVSTNLTRADFEFHQKGSLWRAVRASGTIPGIGPPLVADGELLVDGGILSNLPVSVFKSHYSGNVIAVDVGLRDMKPLPREWNDRVDSGWSLMWKRLNPFYNNKEIMPSLMAILYRTATLGSASTDAEAKLADLYISLELEEHNALDFRLINVISDTGYERASAMLKSADLNGVYQNH